jgi:4-hydroxybenzoate polyprenyltransferase
LLLVFALFLTALNVVIIWCRNPTGDTPLNCLNSSQGFGIDFLFAIFGIVIGYGYQPSFKVLCSLHNFFHL